MPMNIDDKVRAKGRFFLKAGAIAVTSLLAACSTGNAITPQYSIHEPLMCTQNIVIERSLAEKCKAPELERQYLNPLVDPDDVLHMYASEDTYTGITRIYIQAMPGAEVLAPVSSRVFAVNEMNQETVTLYEGNGSLYAELSFEGITYASSIPGKMIEAGSAIGAVGFAKLSNLPQISSGSNIYAAMLYIPKEPGHPKSPELSVCVDDAGRPFYPITVSCHN